MGTSVDGKRRNCDAWGSAQRSWTLPGKAVDASAGSRRDAAWLVVTSAVVAVHAAITYAWLGNGSGIAHPGAPAALQVSIQMGVPIAGLQPSGRPPESIAAHAHAVKPRPVDSIKRLPVDGARPNPAEAPASSPAKTTPDAGQLISGAGGQPLAARNGNSSGGWESDVAPDYTASYLNNPSPAYPPVAKRMGLEGTVVLSVEVLENGRCGQVIVFRSSGHPILDEAAQQAVKTWTFSPTRQGGHAVTRRFRVPIVFSLRDATHG